MRDQITSGDICFKKAYNTKKNIKNVLTKDFSTLLALWQLTSPPIKIEKQITTKAIIVITYIL